MRIPFVPAVGTLSSLDPAVTSASATEVASVVWIPLQTGDTFVASGTTLVVVKTDLAVPIGMMAAAAALGSEAYFTMAPPQETTVTTKCNPFNPNCQPHTAGCSLGCIPDFNGGCEFWDPICLHTSTEIRDIPIPTGPSKSTEQTNPVVTVSPTTTYIEIFTSTRTSVDTETITTTVSGPNEPAETITTGPLMTPDDPDSSTRKHPDQDDYHLPVDELHSFLKEAVSMAAGALRQQYIASGVWHAFLRYGRVTKDQDVNNDGNTADGLAWHVRKELGWPPKIRDPANPQPLDANLAVRDLVTKEELEEVVLKNALDAARSRETDGLEKPAEKRLDSHLFSLDDIFTTDQKTKSMAWQEFKDKKAWQVDADHRPYVLLRHIAVNPPIRPKDGWIEKVQIYINKHIPFGQSGPLPSSLEENLFLELDEASSSILKEIKQDDGLGHFWPDHSRATDDDILEELRYILLHENVANPILVEATAEEVEALKKEFLKDVHFVEAIGGQNVLFSLFSASVFYEGLKGHIRVAKIQGKSFHDLAVTLAKPISEGLASGNYVGHDNDAADNNGKHRLVARGELLDLTPEEKHHLEVKLSFDKDLLEGFKNNQRELISYIMDERFQKKIVDPAIKRATDLEQLEQSLKRSIQFAHFWDMFDFWGDLLPPPQTQGIPEDGNPLDRDWDERQLQWSKDSKDGNKKLEPREDVMTTEKGRHGPLDKDADGEHHGLFTYGKPFLSPKQMRNLCMRKCSVQKEPCAC